jgi:N6-adenosine-specific RNA methylase IME4
MFSDLPARRYEVVYADPPWFYDSGKGFMGAAENHYRTVPDADLLAFPMRSLMADRAVLFMWATCPRLDFAVDCLRSWGLHYRGVAAVWAKTTKDGRLMGARGVRPTLVKPTTELLLAATTNRKGRTFPLLTEAMRQVVTAPTGRHSEKPAVFRDRLVELLGDRPRIELFARTAPAGWDIWGNDPAVRPASRRPDSGPSSTS